MNSREWSQALKNKLETHFGNSLVQVSSEQMFTAELDVGLGVDLTLLSSALAEEPTYATIITGEYRNGNKMTCTYDTRLKEITNQGTQHQLINLQNMFCLLIVIMCIWLTAIGAIDQNRIQNITFSNYKFWW